MNLSKIIKFLIALILGIFVLILGFWVIKNSTCGDWTLEIEGCKNRVQIVSQIAGILVTLATFTVGGVSAYFAVNTYRKNSTLEHAKWLFNLYEKFYEKEHLKDIRNKLDCDENSKDVENLVKTEPFDFTDYLNFFEFVAFLKKSEQLTFEEIEDLFGYYLSCIGRHKSVREYLVPNGYELLDELLKKIEEKRK